jgi:hypothetical protein
METAIQKYERLRDQIVHGSIVLFGGTGILGTIIRWADDNASVNHSALVMKEGNRLLCLDANAEGVDPGFLSTRIAQYNSFRVLVPQGLNEKFLNHAVSKTIDRAEQKLIKYDFTLLPRILVNKKLGIEVKRMLPADRMICSVFTGLHYAQNLGALDYIRVAREQGYFTPEDHIRYKPSFLKELI